jgi:hypothetical protein|tara:strand:- start:28283 stop:28606 length:324 start_codon:yes stop_codon:yes gene_type:complete
VSKNPQLIGATEKNIWKPCTGELLAWAFSGFGVGTVVHAFFIWFVFSGFVFLVDVNRVTIGEHFVQNWYPYFLMLFLLLAEGAMVIHRDSQRYQKTVKEYTQTTYYT